jgi:hypothetical protein
VSGDAWRVCSVQDWSEDGVDGAKNHTAHGLYWRISGTERERSAPQFMKPTPTGRVDEWIEELQRSDWADWRSDARVVWSVPEPMKPYEEYSTMSATIFQVRESAWYLVRVS